MSRTSIRPLSMFVLLTLGVCCLLAASCEESQLGPRCIFHLRYNSASGAGSTVSVCYEGSDSNEEQCFAVYDRVESAANFPPTFGADSEGADGGYANCADYTRSNSTYAECTDYPNMWVDGVVYGNYPDRFVDEELLEIQCDLAAYALDLNAGGGCPTRTLSGIDAAGHNVDVKLSQYYPFILNENWVLSENSCFVRVDCDPSGQPPNRSTFTLSLNATDWKGTQELGDQTIALDWGYEVASTDPCAITQDYDGTFRTYQLWFRRPPTNPPSTNMVQGLAVEGPNGWELVIADFDEGVNYTYAPK